jgi:hypothetical protein
VFQALLSTAPGAVQQVRTTVGERGANLARATPRSLGEVRTTMDERLAIRLVTAGAPLARGSTTVIAAGYVPFTGRAGTGGELRLGPGTPPWRRDRLAALTNALNAGGAALVAGELAVLTTNNGLHDVEERRPALRVSGGLPVRIVAMDVAGVPTSDVTLAEGTMLLPPRTERVVVISGCGHLDGVAGWHSTAQLAQVGSHTLIGPGCTVTSSAVSTRRGGMAVAAAFVTAADAVDGYSVVTTHLPGDVRAVAIVLEAAARIDDERGDAIDLGLTGVRRSAGPDGRPEPPQVIVSGSRTISVYAVEPDDTRADTVEITIACGEHIHLGGVLASRAGVPELVTTLRARDLATSLANLINTPSGSASLRWLDQEHVPDRDEFQEVR